MKNTKDWYIKASDYNSHTLDLRRTIILNSELYVIMIASQITILFLTQAYNIINSFLKSTFTTQSVQVIRTLEVNSNFWKSEYSAAMFQWQPPTKIHSQINFRWQIILFVLLSQCH